MTYGRRALLVQLFRALVHVLRRRRRRRSHRRFLNREKWRRRRERTKAVVVAAKTKACADCGLFYGSKHMEFDHRPGERKRFAVGDGKWRSVKRTKAEIAKCDVVCCGCHEKREVSRGRQHGMGLGRHRCPNVDLRATLVPLPLPGQDA